MLFVFNKDICYPIPFYKHNSIDNIFFFFFFDKAIDND